MVTYELHAQHRPLAASRDVYQWHIVPHGRTVGLCHKALDPVADTRPLGDLPRLPLRTWCQTCLAALRHLATGTLPWDAASGPDAPPAPDQVTQAGARTRRDSRPRAGG